jgi:pimeloyl-ACP methyl ester carboxylesterase
VSRRRRRNRGARAASDGRSGRTGRWLALAGLGSAALLAGLYVVGKRAAAGRVRDAEDEAENSAAARRATAARHRDAGITRRTIAGPAGPLVLLEVAGPPQQLPVLFVHGLAGRAEHWTAPLAALAGERRAAAVSYRGHTAATAGSIDGPKGASAEQGGEAPSGEKESVATAELDYSVPAVAEDIAAAARAAGFERYLLVGHSIGAAVAAAHAAAYPESVAGLLLIDPNGEQSRLPREEIEQYLGPLREDPHGELRFQYGQALGGGSQETIAAVLAALDATPGEACVGLLESAAGHSTVADIEQYGGSTACVVTPLNSLPVSLHRLLPQLPASVVLGTSHWIMLDRPEEVLRLLHLFLARVQR